MNLISSSNTMPEPKEPPQQELPEPEPHKEPTLPCQKPWIPAPLASIPMVTPVGICQGGGDMPDCCPLKFYSPGRGTESGRGKCKNIELLLKATSSLGATNTVVKTPYHLVHLPLIVSNCSETSRLSNSCQLVDYYSASDPAHDNEYKDSMYMWCSSILCI